MFKNLKDRHLIGLLFLVSLTVVFIWFRNGEYIGGGEEGLWIFNAYRSLKLHLSGWLEIDTGVYLPVFLPRIPVLILMTILQQFLAPWASQAVLFFVLIFGGIGGTYYLTRELLNGKNNFICLISALFYFLNLFVMAQVWNRLISSGIFAWSFLPIFLFLWIRWVKTKRIIFLFCILASSIFYSNSFSTIAFLVTIWIPVGLFILFELFANRRNKKLLFILIYQTVLTIILWIIANVWWLYPLFKISAGAISTFNEYDNLGVLKGVSQYFDSREVLLLRQSGYFAPDAIKDRFWYEFYLTPFPILLSVVGLIIVVIGAVSSLSKRNSTYLLSLFILGWFLVKGANPPLGVSFYEFLFSNFPITAMFRNPYEKLGIIFVLPYAIFFGLGIYFLHRNLKRYGFLISAVLIFLICGFLIWPIWSGDIYSRMVRLNVPNYYSQINSIINQDPSEVRILSLPPINGEASRYYWGYTGVVPYEYLFDKPVISRTGYIGSYYQELFDSVASGDIDTIYELLDRLNVRYIVLDHDLDIKVSGSADPEEIKKFLAQIDRFEFVTKIGNISLYKYISEKVGSNIVSAGNNWPVIDYDIKGPLRYVVHIKDATDPYQLILKKTFSGYWEARVDGKKITDHFLVFDYANGWRIDKEGSYQIEIVFKIWPWD